MDVRGWTSRLKKKFKHPGSKHKPDRTGTESGGESVDPASSLSLPLPHVVTGDGHNQEDGGTNSGRQQICLADSLPPPDVEQVPARGGDDDQQEDGRGVDGGQVSQSYSRLHSDFEVVTGSGSGQEGNGVDEEKVGQGHPSPSTPLIPHSGRPDGGTWPWLF